MSEIVLAVIAGVLVGILVYLYAPFPKEPYSNFTGGKWVTRDAKGMVLSIGQHGPVFRVFGYKLKGIKTISYEWDYKQEDE